MIKTKCDSCKNKIEVEPYTMHDVICKKGHWDGDDQTGNEPDVYLGIWDSCVDFENIDGSINESIKNKNDSIYFYIGEREINVIID